jgi:NAD(P)H-nitrite reductase large subunit
MNNYVIIGAGIAGRQAATAIRQRDDSGKITMIEAQADPYFARPMLGDLIGRGSIASQVSNENKKSMSKLGINFITGVSVKELRHRDQKTVLSTGQVLPYDRLLIAQGNRTAPLRCDKGNVSGVYYMDQMADIKAISGVLGNMKNVVVFGDSYQSMGVVRGLHEHGIKCTLIIPTEQLWPEVLDAVAASIIEDRFAQSGIKLIKGASVQALQDNNGALQNIIIDGGDQVAADLLIVTAPQMSEFSGLSESGLTTPNGIIVNGGLETSLNNVYAAGDIAKLKTATMNGLTQLGWLRAWTQGQIAGSNMTGGQLNYTDVPSVRTRIMDLDLVCLGQSAAQGDDVKVETGDYPYDEMPYIYKRMTFKDGKAVGALFLGDVNEAGVVDEWIKKGLTQQECNPAVLRNMFQLHFKSVTAHGVLCPVCKFHMQIEDEAAAGSVITCPVCGLDFKIERLENGRMHAIAV